MKDLLEIITLAGVLYLWLGDEMIVKASIFIAWAIVLAALIIKGWC